MIDRYNLPEFSKIWGLTNKYNHWLQIELTVLEALEKFNFIPTNTYNSIKQKIPPINIDEILKIEDVVKHDVIAFIQYLENNIGNDAKFLHFGITSSDIVDTSFALCLLEALEQILKYNDCLLDSLSKKINKHIHTPIIGRSHGIHAEPTTFAAVLASHYLEFQRNKKRLLQIKEEIAYGKISGAVGNYAHICPELEEFVLNKFNLKAEPVSTQIIPRDRHANYFLTLALVATSIERLATNLRHLQRTEVAEVKEQFNLQQKGSSAMPHKCNPITSENLCGLARIVKGYSSTALDNVVLWHERDISHSSAERFMAPDATTILAYMLNKMSLLINNLVVNEDKMKNNINLLNGVCFSENVLLALIQKNLSRQEAYDLVQKTAFDSINNNCSFKEQVKQNISLLSKEEIEHCFDLNFTIRNSI